MRWYCRQWADDLLNTYSYSKHILLKTMKKNTSNCSVYTTVSDLFGNNMDSFVEENAMDVFKEDLEKILNNNMLQCTRVSMDGILRRRGKLTKKWKPEPLYAELRGTVLVTYKLTNRKYGFPSSRYQLHDLSNSSGVRCGNSSSDLYSFIIEIDGKKPLHLAAPTFECRSIWIHRINDALITVSRSDLSLISVLGQGHFGKVMLAKKKSPVSGEDEFVALKEIKLNETMTISHALTERYLLALLPKHPFVVHMQFCFRDGNYLYYGFDFKAGADLFELIRRFTLNIDQKKAQFYLSQVILGLKHLHENSIVYRDLKPENVLVDREGNLCIADMGLSKKISIKTGRTFSVCGTRAYLAPEMISTDRVGYTFSVDFWQVGCFLYEMYAGRSPFWTSKNEPTIVSNAKILAGEVLRPEGMEEDAWDLTKKLLALKPYERLGVKSDDFDVSGWRDVMSHKFFNAFSFDDVLNFRAKPPQTPLPVDASLDSNFNATYTSRRARWGVDEDVIKNIRNDKRLFPDDLIGFNYVYSEKSSAADDDKRLSPSFLADTVTSSLSIAI